MTNRLPRVTFIGLGAMGLPMATQIAKLPDVDLTLFDISDEAMQRAAGLGRRADSVAEAVQHADVILTMLPADEHVSALAGQAAPHLRRGQVLMDFSTIDPMTMKEVGRLVPEGVQVTSASCMKAVSAARTGDLTLFVGGDQAALATAHPFVTAMASQVIPVGDLRDPKTLKIVNNLVVAGLNLHLAEAGVIANRHGVPSERLFSAFDEQDIGGWPLRNQVIKHALTGDLGTGLFSVRYMAKDVRLASRLCEHVDFPRFLCGPMLGTFRGTEAIGLGDHYHPVIVRWLDHISPPASDGPARSNSSERDVVDQLAAAGRAVEELTAWHGLQLAEAAGVDRTAAGQALHLASAASHAMARFAAGAAPMAPSEAREALAGALELAKRRRVPAFALEASLDYNQQRSA